jgi:hypothetical protein
MHREAARYTVSADPRVAEPETREVILTLDQPAANHNGGNLRAATAVFCFDGVEWTTRGEPKFNLNPAQVIQHYQHELETANGRFEIRMSKGT